MSIARAAAMASNTDSFRSVHQAIAILLTSIAILLSLVAVYSIKWIVLALLVGLGLGIMINPISDFMQVRYKVPRSVTALLFLILFFGAFISVGYFLGAIISEEIVHLQHQLPEIVHSLTNKNAFLGRVSRQINLETYFGDMTNAVLSGVRFGATFVSGVVFLFFVALYFSIQPGLYEDAFVRAFPARKRSLVRLVLRASAHSLRRWFFAQLGVMSIVAILAAVAMKVIGSPYWLFFGALVFVLELVPYFGPITSFVIVCAVTAAAEPGALLKTAAAFAIPLFLEGHVIVPVVMKERVHLPPVHLLFLLAAMGEWFGLLGLLMAAPTLMVLRTVYQYTFLPIVNGTGRRQSERPKLRRA